MDGGRVAALAWVLAICGLIGSRTVGGAVRLPTVNDGLQMTTVATPDCDPVAKFSPDGRMFVVVVRRGDLRGNRSQYTMLLWNTRRVGLDKPRAVLNMNSSSYRPAIDPNSIAWAPDGRSLTFLGENPGGQHQIFRLDLKTGRTMALTRHVTSITSYSVDANGTALAYEALPRTQSLWDASTAKSGLAVTTESLEDLITGRKFYGSIVSSRRLFIQTPHGTREIVPMRDSEFRDDPLERDWGGVSISPDGGYLVVAEGVSVQDIPKAWHGYESFAARMTFDVIRNWKGTAQSTISRYILVNLETGRSRVLLDAPIFGVATKAVVWAPDSRSVILSRTLLPFSKGNSESERLTASKEATVEVSIATGKVTPVGPRCYQATQWTKTQLTCDATPGSIDIQMDQYTKQTYFKRSALIKAFSCSPSKTIHLKEVGGRWMVNGEAMFAPVTIFTTGGMNSPPDLYYKLHGENRGATLLVLNPQFKNLKLAKERMVTWDWTNGQSVTGGLYYPLDYHPGRRYPLVIQTHGFHPGRFEFFGALQTANAAQPLAAHGMFVLQLDDTRLTGKDGWQIDEVEAAEKIYRSGIGHLAKLGLIDPARVGIIGFSRTCLYVKWALTHDRTLFAAASVTEGVDDGYLQYLDGGNNNSVTGLYGGGPFGKQLAEWIKLAPGFNLDRVRSPVLITVPDHSLVLSDWEWFQGLRDLEKPVYMLLFDGRAVDTHLLEVPHDRWLSSELNVEWFEFWLLGREEASAISPRQYSRWEELCDLQKRENPDLPAFCVPGRHSKETLSQGQQPGGVSGMSSAEATLRTPDSPKSEAPVRSKRADRRSDTPQDSRDEGVLA